MSDNVYLVYVLRSQKNPKRHYTGHCEDLDIRISEHNAGKTKSTATNIPWVVIYFERFDTKSEAIAREKYFKSGSGREYLKKLNL